MLIDKEDIMEYIDGTKGSKEDTVELLCDILNKIGVVGINEGYYVKIKD